MKVFGIEYKIEYEDMLNGNEDVEVYKRGRFLCIPSPWVRIKMTFPYLSTAKVWLKNKDYVIIEILNNE